MLTDVAPPRPSAADLSGRPHAVVIGSGFGGLAAAVRLGARGYRVTVLERLDAPGGRAYVYRQDGFTFDAGPTIVTAPFLFEELWQLCGRRLADDVELRPVTPFYRIRFDDGAVFDYTRRRRRRCGPRSPRLSPGRRRRATTRFMAASEAIFRVGFEQLGHVPFGSWTDMARIAPDLVRLRQLPHRSTALVSRYVQDPRLRTVLSFHPLLIGGNPFSRHLDLLPDRVPRAALGRALRHGRHRRAGAGPGRLDRGAGRRRSAAARRCARSPVADGARDRRAAGLGRDRSRPTSSSPTPIPPGPTATCCRQTPRRRWTDRRIERARYSMSLFVWYFGTTPPVPRRRRTTRSCSARATASCSTDIFERKVLADDFSLYLHRPTATDPSLAPPGCDAFYVLSPVPHLDSGTDWRRDGRALPAAASRAI